MPLLFRMRFRDLKSANMLSDYALEEERRGQRRPIRVVANPAVKRLYEFSDLLGLVCLLSQRNYDFDPIERLR